VTHNPPHVEVVTCVSDVSRQHAWFTVYHCIWHGTVVQFRCKKATIM